MNFDRDDFYGDKTRWFIAKVINNRDPDIANRIQIRIRGIHSPRQIDIPQSGLPWAHTALPLTEGGTSGIGRIVQVQPGALVYGVFLDGETSQLPLVLGVLTQEERPTDVQQLTSNIVVNSVDGARATGVGVDASIPPPPSTPEVNSRRLAGMRFFQSNGLSPAQAAGILGNLEAENSAFDPTLQSSVSSTVRSSAFRNDPVTGITIDPNREPSFGIAQWNANAGRFQNLIRFAARIGQPWDEYNTQLRFVLHELRGESGRNDGGSTRSRAYDNLTRTTRFDGGVSDSNSTWIFIRDYERPANGENKLPGRERLARIAYDQFNSSITPNDAGPR